MVKKVDSKLDVIQKIFEEVLAIDMGDSFQFTLIDCSKLEVQQKKYPGYRINIQMNLGKTRIQAIEKASDGIVALWGSFHKKVPSAPKEINEVIKEINSYLKKIIVI